MFGKNCNDWYTVTMFYFGKVIQCLFWIISIVTDKLLLKINIIVIIMLVNIFFE